MKLRHKNPQHTFTIEVNGIANVLVMDVILNSLDTPSKSFKTRGIWDTGASHSVITQEALDALQLKQVGKRKVSTGTISNVEKPTFLVNVYLKQDVVINGVEITVGTIAAEHGINMLIGMDIINLGDFAITNFEGKTCLSFRLPSQHKVDYGRKLRAEMAVVQQHIEAKKGMDNKCICGSGKKFKSCHGKDYELIP